MAEGKIIAIKDLRNNISAITDEVQKNKTYFNVFRRSQLAFKIVPADFVVEKWETILDFTSENNIGITPSDALKVLK
jgi:hypothetical protein